MERSLSSSAELDTILEMQYRRMAAWRIWLSAISFLQMSSLQQ